MVKSFKVTNHPFVLEVTPKAWFGVLGQWNFVNDQVRFEGADAMWQAGGQPVSVGIAASDIDRFTEGEIETIVRFQAPLTTGHSAGVVLGYRSFQDEFYYVEFGDSSASAVAKFEPGWGFRPLVRTAPNELQPDRPYVIKAVLHGQRAELRIDDVRIVDATLPQQSPGHQVGLIATGKTRVTFDDIKVRAAIPRAFVATQFTEPFDRIWLQVIKPTLSSEHFHPIRLDEVAGPNPILADIKRHVAEAAVVIAEITPQNPNVFYEVGYADALHKPLILLAQQGTPLPFDISGYRTIFYQDVIGGETSLTEKLRTHLKAIL
jgi:hypothetical protein